MRGRGLSIVPALICALVGALALAPAAPASATPDKGSLTIHKLSMPEGTLASGTGKPQNTLPSDAEPIKGVTFKLSQVPDIDLGTNAGWKKAAEYDVAQALAAVKSGTVTTVREMITDKDGIAKFDNLALSLYVVEEVSWPAGVTPAEPFLVTIPMSDSVDSATRLYEVHVYPKNAVSGAKKQVIDYDSVQLGDQVAFDIEVDIPRVDVLDGFRIVDQLDKRLSYVDTYVMLDEHEVDEGLYTLSAKDGAVVVDFNQDGREYLVANQAMGPLRVTIYVEVLVVGVISNTAIVYPNQASFQIKAGEPGGPVVTDPVLTKWGGVTVLKKDPTERDKPLPDATFLVFDDIDKAEAAAAAEDANIGHAITINDVKEFTTGADGKVVIDGLRYSCWENGEDTSACRSYYLVEVKAPDGYELLPRPIKFQVTDMAANITITVDNFPSRDLPFTGAAGGWLLYIAGGAILAGAIAIVIRRRKTDAA